MKKMNPAPIVMVLSGYDDRAHILHALQAGADDYLLKKDMTPERLVTQMDRAIAGALPSRNPAIGTIVNALGEVEGASRLTVIELEVLRLAAHQGASAKEISKELSGGRMTARVVAAHWQRIYEKLGVHSQTQAVCAAIERGIITAELPEPNKSPMGA
jgi:DNA-binding NarL/FixJ family response regulator